MKQAGCTLAMAEPVVEIAAAEEKAGFSITTSQRTVYAEKLVLATGGQSYPAVGTTGDGYRLAAGLGTRSCRLARRLCRSRATPIGLRPCKASRCRTWSLKFSIRGTAQHWLAGAGRCCSRISASRGRCAGCQPRGERPCATEHAPAARRFVARRAAGRNGAFADRKCKPAAANEGGTYCSTAFCRIASDAAAVILSGTPADLPHRRIVKLQRRRLVQTVKQFDIPVAGTMGFRKAEVTAGGVSLDEVDSRTMQSKLVPGLFFAGELLDLDGPVGGYNFQAAFSTGWLAGENV